VKILVRYNDQESFHGLVRQRGGDGCLAGGVGVQGIEEDIVFLGINGTAGFSSLPQVQPFVRIGQLEFAGVVTAIGGCDFFRFFREVLGPPETQLLFQALHGADQIFSLGGSGSRRSL